MIQGLIDLRRSNWVKRSYNDTAKKTEHLFKIGEDPTLITAKEEM